MIILINLINSLSIIFLNIFINSIIVNPSLNLEIDSFLEKIILPEGFEIKIYADDVENARSMAISPSGTIFVGNRNEDNVFALKDTDGDNVIDKKYLITNKLKNMPNGVAFHDGDLYVAEVNKIWKFENIEENLSYADKFDEYLEEPILISDDFPSDRHHGWKYISFGPDGKLYVPVGAPCNICESRNEIYASITRMNSDGSNREIYVKGVRNTVGFTWHPETKQLWFTDNGRDMLGDKIKAVLEYVPSAVFPAIIFPGIFINEYGTFIEMNDPKIFGALVAVIVGYFSKNIIATILAGLVSYWFLIFVVFS